MFNTKRPNRKAKLSIAPLLDMIFILLIFFVVSTTFSKLPGVNIDRPDSSSSDKLPPNNILVGITNMGKYYVNQREYTLTALTEKLSLKYSVNSKLSVLIVADQESALKHSIYVMDICKTLGIKDVAIAEEIKK